MAIDLAALKAKLAAQGAINNGGATDGTTNKAVPVSKPSGEVAAVNTGTGTGGTAGTTVPGTVAVLNQSNTASNTSVTVPTVSVPATLGTSKTTEIDHLDFLSKMNSLASAIHAQHPTMPVLLMQIHKQLRADPELVTTLDEDAIGIIVRGLQIQTKTELVAEAVKGTGSRKKKSPALTLDML